MAVVTQNQARDQRYVQLGFPSVFAEAYAASGKPYEWFGSGVVHGIPPTPVGDSVQDQYHEQKRIDAQRMALAGVRATQASKDHYIMFPHNYNVPKPVLSQRKFANPSNGATADIYSARPDVFHGAGADYDFDSHLHGGVIRTAMGQRWVQSKLRERVQQLDDIDNEKASFTHYEAPSSAEKTEEEKGVSQGLSEASGIKLHLELSALLTAFATAIEGGDYSRFALGDLFKFLQILFRVGATSTAEELTDIKGVVDDTLDSIRGVLAGARGAPIPDQDAHFLYTISSLMARAEEYLRRMLGAVDKSPKERKAASRNAVMTLQFSKPTGIRDNWDRAHRGRLAPDVRDVRNANQRAIDAEREAINRGRLLRDLRRPQARLDPDQRPIWAGRQGVFFNDGALPAPQGAVPPRAPNRRALRPAGLRPVAEAPVPQFEGLRRRGGPAAAAPAVIANPARARAVAAAAQAAPDAAADYDAGFYNGLY